MRDPVSGSVGHTVPQHVWVCVTGRWHERYPGVLLEWRRRPDDGWEALATYVIGGGNHAWEVRQGWVQAAHVRPATSAPGDRRRGQAYASHPVG